MIEKEINVWQSTSAKTLFKEMLPSTSSIVIDYGCGKGRYTKAISNAIDEGGKIYALDINEQALKEVNQLKLNNVETMLSNYNGTLPFKDESIDLILIYDLIHQISSYRSTFLKETKRVLKTNGQLSVLPFHLSNNEWQNIVSEIKETGLKDDKQYLNAGLHFEMHEWLHGNSGQLKDIETGTIYNFIKT